MNFNSRLSRFLVAAATAVLLAIGTAVAGPDEVGQPAPPLLARQLDGAALDLAALRGKVVVLNFWATWCTPCRAEMPMLDAFYRQHRAEGLVLLGLSADDRHDRKDAEKIMQRVTYPAALLQEATANGFGSPKVLPITYVIDTQGIIRARLMPTRAGLSEAELSEAVLPLLGPATQATLPPP